MASPHHRRKVAMRMLRAGQITMAEAAQIALVSRQRVREWCNTAGIDVKAARSAYIATIMKRLSKRD